MRKALLFVFIVFFVCSGIQAVKPKSLPFGALITDMGCRQTITKEEMKRIEWVRMPDLPGAGDKVSLGVSAPFTGVHGGKLIVAGGCNFPDKPAADGGSKQYYDEIFMLDPEAPQPEWQLIGKLPMALAYGATVSTPIGIVCIGGNNDNGSLNDVICLKWNASAKKMEIQALPSLPKAMDNHSASYIDGAIYVAGGNVNGTPSNSFYKLNITKVLSEDRGWEELPPFPGSARVQPILVAQQSPSGAHIYLAGGFQPGNTNKEPALPVDLLSYSLDAHEWKTETSIPLLPDRNRRTLTGGCGIPYGDNYILFMGGVNYDCFLNALDRPRQTALATSEGNSDLAGQLTEESKNYLRHPIEWYRFNTALLLYNTFSKEWENLGEFEQLARAGAGAVLYNNRLIIVNGELKPGIRTPQVNSAELR